MQPNFNFLQNIKTTLSNLWGRQPTPTKPLKVVSPIPQNAPPATNQPSTPPPGATQNGIPIQPQNGPIPQPTAVPQGQNAMAYIASQMPPSIQGSATPQDYYPALQSDQFMQQIGQADQQRQGLADLLLLQAFFESGLGRANNGNNVFGVMPPGGQGFQSPEQAAAYQLSPAVLGGGANPNMNILSSNAPLTPQDVTQLYKSYDPASAYLQQLLSVMFPQQQGR